MLFSILSIYTCSAEVSVVSSNLDVLVEHGLRGGGGTNEKPADFRMVQSVCTALLKMAPKKPRADDPLPPFRSVTGHGGHLGTGHPGSHRSSTIVTLQLFYGDIFTFIT